MKTRPMAPVDEPAVRALYEACYPHRPPRAGGWYFAHPTLVLEHRGTVLGSTSFSVSPPPTEDLARRLVHGGEMGWGHGVEVRPDQRGKGFGWQLAEARHQVLRDLGIDFFIGMTQPDNGAMIAIFARQGLTEQARLLRAYPDGGDAVLYAGAVR